MQEKQTWYVMELWIVQTFPMSFIVLIVLSIIFIVEWPKLVFQKKNYAMVHLIVTMVPMKEAAVSKNLSLKKMSWSAMVIFFLYVWES